MHPIFNAIEEIREFLLLFLPFPVVYLIWIASIFSSLYLFYKIVLLFYSLSERIGVKAKSMLLALGPIVILSTASFVTVVYMIVKIISNGSLYNFESVLLFLSATTLVATVNHIRISAKKLDKK